MRTGKGVRLGLKHARRQLKGAWTSLSIARSGIYGEDDRLVLHLMKRLLVFREELREVSNRVGRPRREERQRSAA